MSHAATIAYCRPCGQLAIYGIKRVKYGPDNQSGGALACLLAVEPHGGPWHIQPDGRYLKVTGSKRGHKIHACSKKASTDYWLHGREASSNPTQS